MGVSLSDFHLCQPAQQLPGAGEVYHLIGSQSPGEFLPGAFTGSIHQYFGYFADESLMGF
jgi:hypothetical protein